MKDTQARALHSCGVCAPQGRLVFTRSPSHHHPITCKRSCAFAPPVPEPATPPLGPGPTLGRTTCTTYEGQGVCLWCGRGGHSMAGGVGPGRGECVTWAVSHISPATYQCRCSDPRQAPLPGGSSRIRQGRNACRAPSTGAAGGLSQLSPPPLLDPLFGWPGPAIRPTSWQRGPRVKRLSRGRQNPTPQVRRRERRVTIS